MTAAAKKSVLETVKVREVVGIVHDLPMLENVAQELLEAGVDRADMSLLAPRKTVIKHLDKFYREPEEVVDDPDAPRTELVLDEDETAVKVLSFSTLTAIGSLGAIGLVVASGGALAAAVIAAGAGGAAGAGLGKLVADKLGAHALDQFESDFHLGGLALFVRIRNPVEEAKVKQAMEKAGAEKIRVHEIELKKTDAEIPLADIRPDPLLDNERLGDV